MKECSPELWKQTENLHMCRMIPLFLELRERHVRKTTPSNQSGTQSSPNKQNKCDILKIIHSPTQKQSFLSPWSKLEIKSPIFQKVCFILEIASFRSGGKKDKTNERIFGEKSSSKLSRRSAQVSPSFQAPLQEKLPLTRRRNNSSSSARLIPPQAGSGSRSRTDSAPTPQLVQPQTELGSGTERRGRVSSRLVGCPGTTDKSL